MGGSASKCLACGSSKPKAQFVQNREAAVPQKRRGSIAANTSTIDYKRITAKYKFTEDVLGAGNFGKVFLAKSIADAEFKVAIKTVQKKRILNKLDALKDEIKILSSLDHPNIVKYYETYESPNYLYLVMEYCQGGELFKKLTESRDEFTEQKAARIMRSLFMAVNHLHSNGIAHRDLKPENVMYSSDERIKIIDFGLSKHTIQQNGANAKFMTVVGTPYYLAPEVLQGDYSKECDCWSLGVMMYVILSGFLPFHGSGKAEVYEQVKRGVYTFDHPEFAAAKPSAKDLISKLLTVDKTKRFTCEQALQHQWFVDVLENPDEQGQTPLDPQALRALSEYKEKSELKREALNVLVKMLDETQISHLQEAFQEIDTDKTGMISFSELQQAFENNATTNMTSQRIRAIMKNVDYQGNGKINYSEFLAATVSVRSVLTDEKLYALFKHFDTDNSEYITPDNIREAFQQSGRELSELQTRKILSTHDSMGDGKLSFSEFRAIFFENEDMEMQYPQTPTTPSLNLTN